MQTHTGRAKGEGERAQTALEYVLILSAVIFLALMVILIVSGIITSPQGQISNNMNEINAVK